MVDKKHVFIVSMSMTGFVFSYSHDKQFKKDQATVGRGQQIVSNF